MTGILAECLGAIAHELLSPYLTNLATISVIADADAMRRQHHSLSS
jgi:hypothetical protein